MPQTYICANFDEKYRTIAELKRHEVNMIWKENCPFSSRALVRVIPARIDFAPENTRPLTSCDHLINLYGRPSLLSCPGQPSFARECWFPTTIAQKVSMTYLCQSRFAVSRHCIQITTPNQSDNHASQYPACIYWIYCSVLRSWFFLVGDVENNWSVTSAI